MEMEEILDEILARQAPPPAEPVDDATEL